MRPIRIIPRLDIKGPNLVKGVHLEGLRVLGKPEDFAYRYYIDGADELICMDIVASLYGRNNLSDVVKRIAKKMFIPLTVGGGIRSIEDIRSILRAGADKVAINTAAIKNPNLIKEGARAFGSQCIVISIEAKKLTNGRYEALIDNGRQETGVDVYEWTRLVHELGAGEILVTSVDREGTGEGYDIELVAKIADLVPIPVIACGGAGKSEDIETLIKETNVSAVSAASIFHYDKITKDAASDKFEEGNIEFLKKYSQTENYRFKQIQPLSITDLKLQLKQTDRVRIRTIRTIDNFELMGQADECCLNGSLSDKPFVIVVDYNCGNLFNIEHTLKEIGANFEISDNPDVVRRADTLILPGVGAFREGMRNLSEKDLLEPIKEHANAGRPLLGICLGMQLLMSESEEFGLCKGLNLINGRVAKLHIPQEGISFFKIPHVGWNQIRLPQNKVQSRERIRSDFWKDTILEEVPPVSLMYFVHSYIVKPDNPNCILAETEYGNNVFCSVIRSDNIYGCQFHPERSAALGLGIYRQFVFGIGKRILRHDNK